MIKLARINGPVPEVIVHDVLYDMGSRGYEHNSTKEWIPITAEIKNRKGKMVDGMFVKEDK